MPKNTIFRNGKPLGAERPNDLTPMDRFAKKVNLYTYKDLFDLYRYEIIRSSFPWAKTFRAGIIMVYRHGLVNAECEMLMVHQKEVKYKDASGMHILPMRRGLPKGVADRGDRSALETATREVREETGVDILNPIHKAKLAPTAFIIPRPEKGVEEVIIYFFVTFCVKPDIEICQEELTGYEWVDMKRGLRGIENITNPTLSLMKALEEVNVWGPLSSVKMPEY